MKKILFFASLMGLTFAACSNDDDEIQPEKNTNSIYATTDTIGTTRTALGADGLSTTWTAGDAIGVWDGAAFQQFTLSDGVGASLGRFTGSSTLPSDKYAFYPYGATGTPTALKATLPAAQDETNFAMYDHKVSNNYTDSKFHFRQTMVMLNLSTEELGAAIPTLLNNINVIKAEITSPTANLAGEYTIDVKNNGAAIGTSNASKTVSVDINKPATAATARLFTLPVADGTELDYTVYSDVKTKDNLSLSFDLGGGITIPFTAKKVEGQLLVKAIAKTKELKGGYSYDVKVGKELVDNDALWVTVIGTITNPDPASVPLLGSLDNVNKIFSTVMATKASYYNKSEVVDGVTWYRINSSDPATLQGVVNMLNRLGI